MKSNLIFLYVFSLLFSFSVFGTVHHKISTELIPALGQIHFVDEIQLPSNKASFEFFLARGLTPTTLESTCLISSLNSDTAQLQRYVMKCAEKRQTFYMAIDGKVNQKPEEDSDIGVISAEGVALFSAWFAQIDNELITFELTVKNPQGWSSVSQGEVNEYFDGIETWTENHPQETITLMMAPFSRYQSGNEKGIVSAVYLRSSDEKLAKSFLDVTQNYVNLYSEMLGTYPYKKFIAVENFWETGYGLPSYTLLGPSVIRLPFILTSSYPHEILHNWFGNGVYVDDSTGNWCEGLTSYLADHYFETQKNNDPNYRRDTLQHYRNYVKEDLDFPLAEFKYRYDDVTHAIGYKKGLMFFHALRLRLGDKFFFEGLKIFYKNNLFKRAQYKDLQTAFESVSKIDLNNFFQQRVFKKGAPNLFLDSAEIKTNNKTYDLIFKLRQEGPFAFDLDVPVKIDFTDGTSLSKQLVLNEKQKEFHLNLSQKPKSLHIDPRFDVFRILGKEELPALWSEWLALEEALIVIPKDSLNDRSLATNVLRAFGKNWQIIEDDHTEASISKLPRLILGWNNRLASTAISKISSDTLKMTGDNSWTLMGKTYSKEKHSIALSGAGFAFLAASDEAMSQRLASKLTHYGTVSAVVFEGEKSLLKAQWPVFASPLNVEF